MTACAGRITVLNDGRRFACGLRNWHCSGRRRSCCGPRIDNGLRGSDGLVTIRVKRFRQIPKRVRHALEPARDLREQIGWDVPLASLRAWVFGLRAATPAAEVSYDAAELPALIGQGGWSVEYRDWFGANEVAGSVLALPKRVFATHGATRVKLAIYDWSLGQ